MRSALVHVQCGSDNIVAAEGIARPSDVVGNPFVESSFIGKSAQGFAVGCQQDIKCEHLILTDLPRHSGMVETVADCLAQTTDTFRVSDEILPVEVSQFGMGVVGLSASLDVSGDSFFNDNPLTPFFKAFNVEVVYQNFG